MKACTVCKDVKPREDFYSAGGKKRRGACKSCESLKVRTAKIEVYGELKCSLCGYDRCEAALEAHHRDPTEKDAKIASMQSWSMKRIRAELEKCDLVCANCHREIHQEWRDSGRG